MTTKRITEVGSPRPLLCLRPDHYLRFTGCEHGLSADLHLLGWLSRHGFAFDVVTDYDLDMEGVKLLDGYKGVLTGGHPEYMSARVLDALQAYLDTRRQPGLPGRQWLLFDNGAGSRRPNSWLFAHSCLAFPASST